METYKDDHVILVGLEEFPIHLPTRVSLSGQNRPDPMDLMDALNAEIPGLSAIAAIAIVIVAMALAGISGEAKIAHLSAPIVAAIFEELEMLEIVSSPELNICIEILVPIFLVLLVSFSIIYFIGLFAIASTDTQEIWMRQEKLFQLKLPYNNFVPLWKHKKANKDRLNTCFFHFSARTYKLVIK